MSNPLPEGTIVEIHARQGGLLASLELRWTGRRTVGRGAESVVEDIYDATLRPEPTWASTDVRELLDAAWEAANDGAFAAHEHLQEQLRSRIALRRAGDERPLEFVTIDAEASEIVLVLPAAE